MINDDFDRTCSSRITVSSVEHPALTTSDDIGPIARGGVSLEAAPFGSSPRPGAAGAHYVERSGATRCPGSTLGAARGRSRNSPWLARRCASTSAGPRGAVDIYANDPDQLGRAADWSPSCNRQRRVASVFPRVISRNQTNWSVVAAVAASWPTRLSRRRAVRAGSVSVERSSSCTGSIVRIRRAWGR
jgi:hypothetical protein